MKSSARPLSGPLRLPRLLTQSDACRCVVVARQTLTPLLPSFLQRRRIPVKNKMRTESRLRSLFCCRVFPVSASREMPCKCLLHQADQQCHATLSLFSLVGFPVLSALTGKPPQRRVLCRLRAPPRAPREPRRFRAHQRSSRSQELSRIWLFWRPLSSRSAQAYWCRFTGAFSRALQAASACDEPSCRETGSLARRDTVRRAEANQLVLHSPHSRLEFRCERSGHAPVPSRPPEAGWTARSSEKTSEAMSHPRSLPRLAIDAAPSGC